MRHNQDRKEFAQNRADTHMFLRGHECLSHREKALVSQFWKILHSLHWVRDLEDEKHPDFRGAFDALNLPFGEIWCLFSKEEREFISFAWKEMNDYEWEAPLIN